MKYINIAFTGHRPNKLYGYDLNNPKYKQLFKILRKLLDKIDYDNPGKRIKGIVGGALGFDTLAYDSLYNKKYLGNFQNIIY
nr:MAG TPA: YspA [Caudoviricetes sp.]